MPECDLSKVKYSYFCHEGQRRPCITVAFLEVEGDEVAYGVAIASSSEKNVSYLAGKRIAAHRCACAVMGARFCWKPYNGWIGVQSLALRDIQVPSIDLDRMGQIGVDDFKERLRALREYMPVGRHKIKDKK